MATHVLDVTVLAAKRAAPAKRRMSRESALPDVTNVLDEQEDKATRRQSLASLPSTSGQENEDSTLVQTVRGHHPAAPPERAAKIAAMAKMKAALSPWRQPRRRRSSHKKPPPPAPVPVTPPLPTPPPPTPHPAPSPGFAEEPMEIDNPALMVRALEPQVQDSIVDIDDHDDYFLSPEYAHDIVAYMKEKEGQAILPRGFLSTNPDITSQMRGILVDWLIQVQSHEQLEEETLQLGVVLTDLYLSRAPVPLTHLQLLGITALLLAAKFVERLSPQVGTLCALTAGTYQPSEVLEMEKNVLGVVGFCLGLPLPHFFLRRLLLVHPLHVQVECLASYLIDLSIPSIHFRTVAPSALASSALYVARSMWLPEKTQPWSPCLVHYSGYTLRQLEPSAAMLAKIMLRAPSSKYQGARQKHSAEDPYGAISTDPVLENHPVLMQLAKDIL